ncbi:MAG: guanine nucleotide-binding protein subunit alpha [Geoglossum simile]|nr:MAG: guanine nucleotide-binding protein subunit alpha [Geoglossum simile]
MSIGFGLCDFVAIPAYAWKVYKACKSSSEEFNNLAAEVASLHIVLKETEEYVSEWGANFGPDREAQLATLGKGCYEVLQDLDRLLQRYESLGTHTQRTWDRMKWGAEDVATARQRLSTSATLITAFNMSLVNSSQARVEAKLDRLVAELHAGKRNSSVISSRTIESLSKSDYEAWRQLRKELQDMGISVAVLNEHRLFITDWLKKAIDNRVLEEKPPKELVNGTLEDAPSVMVEQKVRPWVPLPGFLDKGLTSSTIFPVGDMTRPLDEPTPPKFAPVEEIARPLDRKPTPWTLAPTEEMDRPPFNEKSVDRAVEPLGRSQLPSPNRIINRHALHTRVSSFLSKVAPFDIQPRRDKERARNGVIEKQLERERITQRNEIKLLLLDDNEPGNSTLLKQLRLQYTGGYTAEEQESFKSVIFSNILQSMKAILKEIEQTGISLDGTHLEPYSRAIQLLQPRGTYNEKPLPVARTAIGKLWGDPNLQQVLRRSEEYSYFNSIDRIITPTYSPTDKDILHARVKTTGITEQRFDMGTTTYRIFDAVYPDKRQLIQYFEQVTAIIFSVDLAESDRVVDQATNTCLLQEDIAQFDAICNSRCFSRTPVILYLNNADCFYDKLNVLPLSTHFLDYQGGSDNLTALDYIHDLFQRLNRTPSRNMWVHLMSSMDTSQLSCVEKSVNNIILQTNVDSILR